MKSGIRILALTTAPIQNKKNTLLVGVIGRYGVVEGVISSKITVDGSDSTQKIIRLFKGSRFREQIRLIAVNGVALAGLNLIDMRKVEKSTGTMMMSVTRTKPHPSQLEAALKRRSTSHGANPKDKLLLLEHFKELNQYRSSGFYIQTSVSEMEISNIVVESVKLLRLAHIIARGVSTGESKGRM